MNKVAILKKSNNKTNFENEMSKFFISYYVSNKVTKKINRFFYKDFTNKLMQTYGK